MPDDEPPRKRRPQKPRKGPRRYILGVCRDCGLRQETLRRAFYRAALPRCTACGGALDRLGHLKPR
ncbi:MAG TPA: hypothetical protein VF170_01000 [Planctomycetaceae bacterium]